MIDKIIAGIFSLFLVSLICISAGLLRDVGDVAVDGLERFVRLAEIGGGLALAGAVVFGLIWLGRRVISGVQQAVILHHEYKMREIERLNASSQFHKLGQSESLVTNQAGMKLIQQDFQPIESGGGLLDTRYNEFHAAPTIRTVNHNAAELPVPDETPQIQRGHWLESFVLSQGKANFHHLQICGATGSGKTTLALAVVELLQRPLSEAEYYLSDPKWEGVLSSWPFQPLCYEFEDVPDFANFVYDNIYQPRKAAVRRGQLPAYSAFALFDEVDGCFSEHNGAFIKPVKRIIKEARHAKLHGVLIGQSPLAQDCGLNTSDMQQAARLVLGGEALRYLNNPSFPYAGDKEQKKIWREQVRQLERNGERSCLAIPQRGQPFVTVVPEIEVDSLRFENMARTDGLKRLASGKNGALGRPSGKRPTDYEGKAREVANAIAAGLNKTETRKRVRGANAEIGKLYDQVAKEMVG